MALNKDEMIKQCLEAIEEHGLISIEEIVAFVPFGKTTFYEKKLNETNEIIKSINDQKIKIKSKLRKKWSESKSPALQIVLYKLICSPEEFERLASQKIDHTSKGDSIKPMQILVDSPESAKELKSLLDAQNNSDIKKE